jgi:hypothetical protein
MSEVLEMIVPFFVFMGLGSMVLIGMKLRYEHLQRLRRGESSPEEVNRLAEAVDALGDEVRLMREEVLSINDRVEFTERLLEQPKTVEPKPASRPRQ